jgi:hypothetical protein
MALDLSMVRQTRSCRVCGCTDDNCAGCIEKTGLPCHWVLADLCSACMRVPSPEEESFLLQRGWQGYGGPYRWLWLPPDAMDQWQSLDEALEAAGWKDGAAARLRATTGAGAAAGPAHTQDGANAHDGPGLGGLQTDPGHAAAGGAGNSGVGGRSNPHLQEPTGPLRGVRSRMQLASDRNRPLAWVGRVSADVRDHRGAPTGEGELSVSVCRDWTSGPSVLVGLQHPWLEDMRERATLVAPDGGAVLSEREARGAAMLLATAAQRCRAPGAPGDGYEATDAELLDSALAALDLDDQARVLLMSLGDRVPRLRALTELADASPGLLSSEMRERVAGFLSRMGARIDAGAMGARIDAGAIGSRRALKRVIGLMAAERTPPGVGVRIARGPELFVRLWECINGYAVATGGDAGEATISGQRMDAVASVESAVAAIAHDACLTAQAFAREGGWRSLAQAIGEPGLELEPERLVAVLVERLNVLEACKMPDDPELGALLRAAAGLPPPVVSALREVAEAASGDVEAGTVRAALGRFVGLIQCMVWGRIADQVIEHHVDDAVVVREVLGRSGFLLEVEHIGAWTTEQRRAALLWATLERFQEPPAPAPAFLEEGVGE